ncbi:MAG TPA: hypothetical protein VHB78_13655 [Vicinamibacterales bacterium]|jgi:hypothetical protein|nr:hypothetical protein [Vicinamibacterales bacterium]
MPFILATIATLACGEAPTAPGPITTPTPKTSVSAYPAWLPPPPTHQDGVSLAVVEVSAVTVPPPTLYPPPNTDSFAYLPTFVLRETGGAYGATMYSIQFGANGYDPTGDTFYFGNVRARVEAGSQWEFQNAYVDVGEPVAQPLTHLTVRVYFLGDDGKLGTAEGTWTADTARQP